MKHFDGKGWTYVNTSGANLQIGFAGAPNDAIALDSNRRPWQWDGTRWRPITLPIFGDDWIEEFWGSAPDDVWAIGTDISRGIGSIHHWDGNNWQRVYTIADGLEPPWPAVHATTSGL
jgi:hypothetical protein